MSSMTVPRLLALALFVCTTAFGVAHGADTANNAAPEFTSQDLDRSFRREPVQIATPDARLHRFNMWIADDDQRRARGLMFIRQLGAEDAMLFIYPQSQSVAMWMKNTYVPLDMLFVAADGKVVNIVAHTEPLSLKTIESKGIVQGVIELPAGAAARLKIAPGAQVIHPAFSTAPR
ncbi:DUF192 domain-containing protein [Steroidobacter sp.]|uniref:DUF192 domain-containing protein n=1 Tax=Steroidobacter sp. TaxID=1978227 RepID=UPI001A5E2490|nr:DUF192 domain-containing protein [Steroidobacter sp.]MBL8269686.1 DUF192 domain-containing protein [Steroidobacter sp.]